MLKVVVYFILVVIALSGAHPCAPQIPKSAEMRNRFYEWLKKSSEPILPRAESTVKGDYACDRGYKLSPGSVITQDYFDNNICLVLGEEPLQLDEFCSDFLDFSNTKQEPRLDITYYVMLATPSDILNLEDDISVHILPISEHKDEIPPIKQEAAVHFYTDSVYDFIQCAYKSGSWTGSRLYDYYAAYTATGTEGNPDSVYSMHKGCDPVMEKPGFSAEGGC